MDFWRIDTCEKTVEIKWNHNYHEDYKKLASDFFECGYETLKKVIKSGHDNRKSDMWFLTSIFLVRQSMELGLKALICRIYLKNPQIQDSFLDCKHDLSKLFSKYCESQEEYLDVQEIKWLRKYLASLEKVDEKSDIFRFPFEDEFLSKYHGEFLDNVDVANNLLQAYSLIDKCIKKAEGDHKFYPELKPEFFIFTKHGIGNCYLWQKISDEGFHVKITGYSNVIDYIYQNPSITKEIKLFPLMFMFRNTIELCLKRLFYSRVEDGIPVNVFFAKRKSHLIKKELWKNVKPVITKYANASGNDLKLIDVIENMIDCISGIDKNGDGFRYPTSYSLKYHFDNKKMDIENVYKYNKALINFLDACDMMFDAIAEEQREMKEYETEMRGNMEWK